jgi:hypothetical protein
VTTPNGPLINFMEFVDTRQRMLERFRTHLDRISLADPHALAGSAVDTMFWPPADSEALVLWRLHGRNRRELARSARTFGTVEKAQLNARALVAADERLVEHLVRIGDEFSWCLSLFGTPALVATRWFDDEEQALAACELAKHELATAGVPNTRKKLTIAATGPLSVDTAGAPKFPSPPYGLSRPGNGLPNATDVASGTRD